MEIKLAFLSSFALLTSLAVAVPAGGLTEVTDFGPNPSGTKMYVYVPSKLAAKPAVIVACHACQNTAQSTFSGSPYAQLADQRGNSIANMVTYALSKYQADETKVYLLGMSSGAMMANVMAATYPELFNSIIVHSGVPAGCFVSASNKVDEWNNTCSKGKVNNTPTQWANVVHDMYPGYDGRRPRMMIVHGGSDTTLYPSNYNETIKQWVGVFGLSETPTSTLPNTPQSGYTTFLYGTQLKGVWNPGYGHGIPIILEDDVAWMEV